jgi:hypothetical protein
MSDEVPCSKDEAWQAVVDASWMDEPEESYEIAGMYDGEVLYRRIQPEGTRMIHTFKGSIGCDISLQFAKEKINEADDIVWLDHLFNHDLYVGKNGSGICLDVRKP